MAFGTGTAMFGRRRGRLRFVKVHRGSQRDVRYMAGRAARRSCTGDRLCGVGCRERAGRAIGDVARTGSVCGAVEPPCATKRGRSPARRGRRNTHRWGCWGARENQGSCPAHLAQCLRRIGRAAYLGRDREKPQFAGTKHRLWSVVGGLSTMQLCAS
jgi:hypothetical protein